MNPLRVTTGGATPSENPSEVPRPHGERIEGLHAEVHPRYVQGCLLCKLSTVNVSPSATPTRQSDHAKWAKQKDIEWTKDMAAYKRLRDDGLQPKQIDGSADLEARAEAPEHIETGHPEWPVEKIREAEDIMGKRLRDASL